MLLFSHIFNIFHLQSTCQNIVYRYPKHGRNLSFMLSTCPKHLHLLTLTISTEVSYCCSHNQHMSFPIMLLLDNLDNFQSYTVQMYTGSFCLKVSVATNITSRISIRQTLKSNMTRFINKITYYKE